MYYNYSRKRINDWTKEDRQEGMNRRSARYFLEFKEISQEFSRNNAILYFLIKQMGMTELSGIFGSHIKQKRLVRAVMADLKQYAMTEDWEKAFDLDIRMLRERTRYVFAIIKANIKLTELYPYFEQVGFDKLMDFSVKYNDGDDEAADALREEIEKWNAEHQDEIKAHMDATAEERENLIRYRARIAEDNKAEKKARRLARKAQNDEVKEIRRNAEKHRKHRMKVEREFNRYYK